MSFSAKHRLEKAQQVLWDETRALSGAYANAQQTLSILNQLCQENGITHPPELRVFPKSSELLQSFGYTKNAVAFVSHNAIIIGEELMEAKTADETKGVLAHEIGHLLKQHQPPVTKEMEREADRIAVGLLKGNPEGLITFVREHPREALKPYTPHPEDGWLTRRVKSWARAETVGNIFKGYGDPRERVAHLRELRDQYATGALAAETAELVAAYNGMDFSKSVARTR